MQLQYQSLPHLSLPSLPYMVVSYKIGIEVIGIDPTSIVVDITQSHVQTDPNVN